MTADQLTRLGNDLATTAAWARQTHALPSLVDRLTAAAVALLFLTPDPDPDEQDTTP